MKDENNNYISCAVFFFFIVVLVIGCSIFLYINHKSKVSNVLTNISNNVSEKKKKDKEKEFIYFTDEGVMSENLQIVYKKAIINLDSSDAVFINEKLNNLYELSKNTYVLNIDENVCDNDDKVFSATILNYAVYSYSKYVNLLITEDNYSCGNTNINKQLSYTFDVTTGEYLDFNALLDMYNVTYTEVLEKVKEQLENNQIIVEDVPTIRIEDTINELKENDSYVIYISETGNLIMKYIVKTNSVDYNDIIEIN